MRGEAVVGPVLFAVDGTVGIVDGKAAAVVAGKNDEVSAACEVAGAEREDNDRAGVQRVFHRLLPQRKLGCGKAEQSAALADKRPRAAVSGHAVAVFLGKARDEQRRVRGVFREIHRRHRQAGRAAAGGADKAAAVWLIAPTLIPLDKQRYGAALCVGRKVNVKAPVLQLRVVVNIVQSLRTFLGRFD